MSKTTKNTCTYVITRGAKSGQKCGAPCRNGTKCKNHNSNRKEFVKSYNEKYFEDKKKKRIVDKINELKNDDGLIPDTIKEIIKFRRFEADAQILWGKIFACKIFLDPDTVIPIKLKVLNYIKSQEFKDERRKDYDNYVDRLTYIMEYKDWLKQYRRSYEDSFPRYLLEDEKTKEDHEEYTENGGRGSLECFIKKQRLAHLDSKPKEYFKGKYEIYCNRTIKPEKFSVYLKNEQETYLNNLDANEKYIRYTEYTGTTTGAKKRLRKLTVKKRTLIAKLKNQKYYIDELEKISEEIEKEKSKKPSKAIEIKPSEKQMKAQAFYLYAKSRGLPLPEDFVDTHEDIYEMMMRGDL